LKQKKISMRDKIFWFQDFLRGKKVTNHYEQIKLIIENKDTAVTKKIQETNLNDLLSYAVDNTDFYKSYKDFTSLQDFPVVNKNIIREDYSQFISKQHNPESLYKVTTSGSTGTPFTAYQDGIKRARHTADNIIFNEKAKLRLGDKLYYFRIWNKINQKGRFKKYMQNIVECDAGVFTKDALEQLLNQLREDVASKSMLAYSSTYEALATKIAEYNLSTEGIQMTSIITMSERLPEHSKEALRTMFCCPVVSRYSNMENGFIAQQCLEENNEYHINTASFHIEILQFNNDRQVEQGEMGRIVVTDLFNFGMPIIRYDTGDVAIMNDSSSCEWNTAVFSKVFGRKVDFIFSTDDNIISPHVITNTMWKYPDIQQFQFVQKGKTNYLLKLNSAELSKSLEKEIVTDFRSYLGNNAEIKFEYVNEIPVLNSGKRKKIVNEYRTP